MFEVITKWNFSKPNEEMSDSVNNITLRGYDGKSFLTGEFARKISDSEIPALSLSSIAGKYCATRRDLYFEKGINRLAGINSQESWTRKVGYVVEDYVDLIMNSANTESRVYDSLISDARIVNEKFNELKKNKIDELTALEKTSPGIREGSTEWLKVLLSNMGRSELGLKLLHSFAKEDASMGIEHISIKPDMMPHPSEIGINAPATPDFIIPEFGAVGDIKSGLEFSPYFLLTCTGYALAYENEKGPGNDINWGIIYFFPTRNQSEFVKPLSFAQVYIFPIDDRLREWFTFIRDEAYNVISNIESPVFPMESQRGKCIDCRFKDNCKEKGLDLTRYE